MGIDDKLCADADLASRVALLPRPLVFTNGVFDLLHRGHVVSLEAARALGASLVVGVNSDASARGLGKDGPPRPLVPQDDRARVVAALASVDLVVVFDAPTPRDLIERLRPDVYAKGADYAVERLPEAALVRAWGGRAVALPFVDGRSTSALLARIRAGA
jgi:rfaE bifunctional protein nucleotidyltransferase chain/domain